MGKIEDTGVMRHRLVGMVFITLHNEKEYKEEAKADVLSLILSKKVKINAHYEHQQEVIFIGGVRKASIVAAVPVILPDLSEGHQEKVKDSAFYKEI
jgi:hypothetical protein